mgnify:CR=1 FL=1
MLCGQIVDKLSSVDKFIIFSISINSLFYKGLRGYLPQQFLYFLPLPQVLTPRILLVFIIFIILSVFVGVTRQCTFGIYHIISTYSIYNISLRMSNRCHWHLTKILIYSLLIKQFIYLIFIYHSHYNNKKEEKSIF